MAVNKAVDEFNKGEFRSIGSKDRLVERVVNEIQRLIVAGKLLPGIKLPPEREFSEQLGVSRTVLREAVRILVTKGLLTTRHGVGTVVQQVTPEHISQSLSLLLRTQGISLDNLHQVRSILEVENAKLAALQATEQDLADLHQILHEMEKATLNPLVFASKDDEFHRTLARTTRNPLLMVLLDSIHELLQEVRLSVSAYPGLHATVVSDHRQIMDEIVARDVEGACAAMQQHLEHARDIQERLFVPIDQVDAAETRLPSNHEGEHFEGPS